MQVARFHGAGGEVGFVSDGSMLSAVGEGQSVVLWEPTPRRLVRELTHPADYIPKERSGHVESMTTAAATTAVTWDGDTYDSTVRLWNLKTGELRRSFGGPGTLTGPLVSCAAIDAEGTRVISGDSLGHAHLWDADTGEEIFDVRAHDGAVAQVAISPDRRLVLTCGEDADSFSLKLWSASTGEPLLNVPTGYCELAEWTPDGGRVILAGGDAVGIRDGKSVDVLVSLPIGHVRDTACSPDGTQLALAVGAPGPGTGRLTLYDLSSGAVRFDVRAHDGDVSCVSFSPDGRRVATGGYDRTVKIWDVESGDELLTLTGHESFLKSVAFSRDGSALVSGDASGRAIVWKAD